MEVGLAVGGAFISSALNVIFDRMTPKFPNLFQGRKGDEQLLRKLKTSLLAIHAVLDDAEDKLTTNRHVKEWLNELKDIVYHAEDLVDEINTEALRLEVEGGEQSVTNKFCITSTSAGLDQILPWMLFYHKVIRVSNFFLFVEGKASSPDVSEVLEFILLLYMCFSRIWKRHDSLRQLLSDVPNNVAMVVFPNYI